MVEKKEDRRKFFNASRVRKTTVLQSHFLFLEALKFLEIQWSLIFRKVSQFIGAPLN